MILKYRVHYNEEVQELRYNEVVDFLKTIRTEIQTLAICERLVEMGRYSSKELTIKRYVEKGDSK